MDKNTDTQTIMSFSSRVDKNSKLNENSIKQAQARLEDGEEILYISLCDVCRNYTRFRKTLVVLTDRRFILMRPAKLLGAFAKDPLEIDFEAPLDQVGEHTLETIPQYSARRTYLKIVPTKKEVYDIELPMNTLLPKDNAKYEDAIYAAFNNAINNSKWVMDYSAKQAAETSQLEQLKDLLDSGLITEQDYEAKKKQILGL